MNDPSFFTPSPNFRRSHTPQLKMASSSDGRTSPSLIKWQECPERRKRRRSCDEESEESEDGEEEVDQKVEQKEAGIHKRPSGKWRGGVSDTMYSAMNPGSKKRKMRITPCFSTRAEAVKARAELKAKVNEECETIVLARVKADPLVKDLPRAPEDISEAVRKKSYWVCTYKTKFIPKRVMVKGAGKQGLKWVPACSHDNRLEDCMSCSNGKNNFCSALCGTRLAPIHMLSSRGSGLCAGCDPDRQTKRKQEQPKVSREQFFAIANDQHFPDLSHESVYGVACDETLGSGASRRRPDLATRLLDRRCRTEFVHLDECDEGQHLRRTSCYDRDGVLGKLSGHMHDIGAPAIPKEDAAYVDANPLTPEEKSGEVENAKTRNVSRVLNKVITQQQAQMIPIRVLSVGVDGYTDSTGKRHKSAFVEYKNEKGEARIRTNPEEWEHRLQCFVREKKKLLELGASGASIVHVRLFYNGSDRETGLGAP